MQQDKTVRVMKFTLPNDNKVIDRLMSNLQMCCMPYMLWQTKEKTFAFIWKGNCTWEQVKDTVHRVYPAKFRYTRGILTSYGKLLPLDKDYPVKR